MKKLYHRNVYWKNYFDEQSMDLVKSANKLSEHLWNHIDTTDKKHDIDLTKLYFIVKDLQSKNVVKPFEVEVEDYVVTKAVIRTKYNDTTDISIVFRYGVVITAWINNDEDDHLTLDESKYNTHL